MTPAELDEWALEMRESMRDRAIETGEVPLGAFLMVTKNPETLELLSAPTMVPVATYGVTKEHHEALAHACDSAIRAFAALAILIFTRRTADGKPHMWLTYERRDCMLAREWYCEMLPDGTVGEYFERAAVPAFFTRPAQVPN